LPLLLQSWCCSRQGSSGNNHIHKRFWETRPSG
jgi:hypothetical protein